MPAVGLRRRARGVVAMTAAVSAFVSCHRHPTAEQCDALWSEADSKLDDALQKNVGCASDDDCTLTYGGSGCAWTCQTGVSRLGLVRYKAMQDLLKIRTCKEYVTGGCPKTTPHTAPSCGTARAVCNAGRCEAKPTG